MSDPLKHECGVAVIRLLKPLAYFIDKYGTSLYGFNKLFLLMEKQHNRGQDGAGIGSAKLNMPLGQPYMFRSRSAEKDALSRVFREAMMEHDKLIDQRLLDPQNPESFKSRFEFGGEILLGHLRYGTSGRFSAGACHPYMRRSNWPTKTLMVIGNFNMTNAVDLNHHLIDRGQHPVFETDTQTVLEEIGFHLDEEHTDIYRKMRDEGVAGREIPGLISKDLDIPSIIRKSAEIWDGGYSIAGVVGNGDAFVLRDPRGIRPCFYYRCDELIAFASERVPLMTVFDAAEDEVEAVKPGEVVTIKSEGSVHFDRFADPVEPANCSFERIYFSRGNDPSIYQERKAMGEALVPQIIESIDGDFENTVFSYVPNTAEIAYYGMMDGLRVHRRLDVKRRIGELIKKGICEEKDLDELIMHNWPRGEKVANKDIKMRTFISQDEGRDQLVSHVYDITYGIVREKDNLVVIDDSIVRGTTLRKSILKILARTNPRKIVIVSTAPQIRYPDCYGIDMADIGRFIAFQAAVSLLKRNGRQVVLDRTYDLCVEEARKPAEEMRNCVKDVYAEFTPDEISAEIGNMVYPQGTEWKGEIEVIYQTIGNLRAALTGSCGDWYFTGNYPTFGGVAMVNHSFVRYYENKQGRAYDMGF